MSLLTIAIPATIANFRVYRDCVAQQSLHRLDSRHYRDGVAHCSIYHLLLTASVAFFIDYLAARACIALGV